MSTTASAVSRVLGRYLNHKQFTVQTSYRTGSIVVVPRGADPRQVVHVLRQQGYRCGLSDKGIVQVSTSSPHTSGVPVGACSRPDSELTTTVRPRQQPSLCACKSSPPDSVLNHNTAVRERGACFCHCHYGGGAVPDSSTCCKRVSANSPLNHNYQVRRSGKCYCRCHLG